jgi:hypothetical protein
MGWKYGVEMGAERKVQMTGEVEGPI